MKISSLSQSPASLPTLAATPSAAPTAAAPTHPFASDSFESMDAADQIIFANSGQTFEQLVPMPPVDPVSGQPTGAGDPSSADPGASATPADPGAAPSDPSGAAPATPSADPSATGSGDPAAPSASNPIEADLEKLVSDGIGLAEQFLSGLLTKLGDSIEGAADGVVSQIGSAAQSGLSDLVGKALQGLESVPLLGSLIKPFEGTLENAANGVIGDLVGAGEKAVDGLISKGIGGLENAAGGLVSQLGSSVGNWIDGELGKLF